MRVLILIAIVTSVFSPQLARANDSVEARDALRACLDSFQSLKKDSYGHSIDDNDPNKCADERTAAYEEMIEAYKH